MGLVVLSSSSRVVLAWMRRITSRRG